MIRSADDEARSPKYAHVERERRWLAGPARPDLKDCPSVLIEDRYIIGARLRLRRMTNAHSGEHALKLTKKYEAPDPLARPIVTAYLSENEYDLLAALPAAPITKRRYAVADGGLTYSLDCFLGALAGLELVEIEWPDDAGLRDLPPPHWALREVSDDPRYQGGALATLGHPG